MLIKIFKHGGGSAKSVFNYLLGKEQEREKARVLRGSVEQTSALIDSLDFKQRYKSGCLSFEEADIPEAAKHEIMDLFETTIFAGLSRDQYDITWVEHTDKNRLELNFVIPQVELTTGKRLNPYYYIADKSRVNAFRDVVNIGYGYTDPTDPAKVQLSSYDKRVPDTVDILKSQIEHYIMSKVEENIIHDRKGVKAALEDCGYKVVRETSRSLSIANPLKDGKRNIRLKGALYEADFSPKATLDTYKQQQHEKHAKEALQRSERALTLLETALHKKEAYHKANYRRDNQPRPATKDDSPSAFEILKENIARSPFYIKPRPLTSAPQLTPREEEPEDFATLQDREMKRLQALEQEKKESKPISSPRRFRP